MEMETGEGDGKSIQILFAFEKKSGDKPERLKTRRDVPIGASFGRGWYRDTSVVSKRPTFAGRALRFQVSSCPIARVRRTRSSNRTPAVKNTYRASTS
jgi:hypothetical protein